MLLLVSLACVFFHSFLWCQKSDAMRAKRWSSNGTYLTILFLFIAFSLLFWIFDFRCYCSSFWLVASCIVLCSYSILWLFEFGLSFSLWFYGIYTKFIPHWLISIPRVQILKPDQCNKHKKRIAIHFFHQIAHLETQFQWFICYLSHHSRNNQHQ